MSVLRTEGLVKRYGALVVTDQVSLDIQVGELHAVIGPNGAGKTTLINQLSGELRADHGRIFFEDTDVTEVPIHGRARLGLMRSYQIVSLFEEFTALENAALAALGAKQHIWRFWRPMVRDVEVRRHGAPALPDEIRLVGLEAVHGDTVLLRVHRHRAEAKFCRRAKDADGDLGAVGGEDFFERTKAGGSGRAAGVRTRGFTVSGLAHKSRCL